ncbi:hypothetical protein [Cetobacterium sp.]|uniref:hypothetical protein n=1 Tax=Cetobacterium sp. TaxID=2071632 RepID=UPI003F315852
MKKHLLKLYYLVLNFKEQILINYNKKIFSKIFKVKVENTDKTISKLLSEKISMSRFGDGEFSLMNGRNLKFQKYDGVTRFVMKSYDMLKVA